MKKSNYYWHDVGVFYPMLRKSRKNPKKRRQTTEGFLDASISGLTVSELKARKARLEKLMDEVSSPKWYSVIVEKYHETRKALEAQANPGGQLLFRTRAAAVKYAREHGAKKFSVRKLKRGRA